jgi:outer membrane protein
MPGCKIEATGKRMGWGPRCCAPRSPGRGLVGALAAALLLLPADLALAETLREALASAYQNNPRLDAERARLRATDEEVPRARSGYRPRVTGSADVGVTRLATDPSTSSEGDARPWGYSITVSQTLFNGLRTLRAVDEAEASVRAGREQLRSVEQQVLLDAVTAYADVVRDQEVVRLREGNVAVLTREVAATETRQAAREVTRTDVAQAKARLARAISQLDQARGSLKASRAGFSRAVGRPPGPLVPPAPPRSLLPKTLEEALAIAARESPGIAGALYREAAERHGVARIRGELLPEVRVEASYANRTNPSVTLDREESASVQGRLSMPLYEGGETYARVRQAKHRHVSRLQEIEQARQEAEAGVTQAWARYQASRSQLRADGMQVEAARLALDGVRREERAGQRTVLDLLNAEQELIDAQVQLASTRREVVVGAYTVLAQMGRLAAVELAVTATAYDPEAHYEAVRGRWFGLSITHANGASETLNVAADADPDWRIND